MGLYPDLLPGYLPLNSAGIFAKEYGALPETPGLNLLQMMDAAARGDLAALYVVGSNPVARYGVSAEALKDTFLVVQDMFLTETASLADVVLPAASAYEKSGTMTNAYGDLQLVKKGGDHAGVRGDFEIIVRLAGAMGADIRSLVPYGRGASADLGQSRGAQSGEADRHAVWLAAQHLEPRVSPFDSNAVLDEIHRLVPGYQNISRLTLASGNDQHTATAGDALVQINLSEHAGLVLPSRDTLFTSGTLGRYCDTVQSVPEAHQEPEVGTIGMSPVIIFILLSILKVAVVTVILLTVGRLHCPARAQGRRAHPKPLGTQPRRPLRTAAAGRRRHQAVPQRRPLARGRLPAALHRRAHYRAVLRADFHLRHTLRRELAVSRRRDVSDHRPQHRPARHSRRHLHRRLRHRTRRMVVQQ